ncbi:hypothetical protein Rleg10DRAFT_3451 [Rhizobium leguminosarum bv. trifolii WSM2012]|nr:hypothetical protein Rleg10DRAFT_3451 [Rhizobium leguminosarum bv. trifolii WSM2012]
MTVFHQPVQHEAQLGFLAFALLGKPCNRVGRENMRLVGTPFAVEVCFHIPIAAFRWWFWWFAIIAPKGRPSA